MVALDRAVEQAHPGPLPVALPPGGHRVGQHVELHAPLVLAGPHVGQRPAQLGVPQQRRQVVERDHHADVVDRAVGGGPDGPVGERPAPEQPQVAGRGGGDGLVQSEGGGRSRPVAYGPDAARMEDPRPGRPRRRGGHRRGGGPPPAAQRRRTTPTSCGGGCTSASPRCPADGDPRLRREAVVRCARAARSPYVDSRNALGSRGVDLTTDWPRRRRPAAQPQAGPHLDQAVGPGPSPPAWTWQVSWAGAARSRRTTTSSVAAVTLLEEHGDRALRSRLGRQHADAVEPALVEVLAGELLGRLHQRGVAAAAPVVVEVESPARWSASSAGGAASGSTRP